MHPTRFRLEQHGVALLLAVSGLAIGAARIARGIANACPCVHIGDAP